MERHEAIQRLKTYEPSAAALGVRSLYVFGSTARDQGRADSDVDIFVDYDADRFGLFELARLGRELSAVLGRRADVGPATDSTRCCAKGSSGTRCASFEMAAPHESEEQG